DTFQETQSWNDMNGPSCLSRNGKWYLMLSWDGDFLLKEFSTGRELHPRFDIKDPREAAFSPDGKFLAVASQLGYIRLWETATFKEVANLGGFLIGAHSVAFSPDGTRIIAGGDGTEAVKIWDLESRQELLTLEGEGATFWTPNLAPNGDILGSLQQDGVLYLWRAPSWEEIAAAEAAEQSTPLHR